MEVEQQGQLQELPPAPNHTLYINNINEKIKISVLKKTLKMVFSQYGKTVQIIASKGLKMRGQAWIVFKDVPSAENALKGKQGFNFYDKPLKIAFAKEKSHSILKREGLTPVKRVRKRTRDDVEDRADDEDESSNKEQRLDNA